MTFRIDSFSKSGSANGEVYCREIVWSNEPLEGGWCPDHYLGLKGFVEAPSYAIDDGNWYVRCRYRGNVLATISVGWPEGRESPVCSFHGLVPLAGVSGEFELELDLVPESEGRPSHPHFMILVKGNRKLERKRLVRPNAAPLCSFGRSGSTVAMRALSVHPAIGAARMHPYEVRYGLYAAQWYAMVTAPADLRRSWRPGDPNHTRPPAAVGRNPYFQPRHLDQLSDTGVAGAFSRTIPARLRRTALASIRDFYRSVAGGRRLRAPPFFMEKVRPAWPLYLMRELFPDMRPVFLVRDFRDMVASIMAFNRKRGVREWGEPRTPDAAWMYRLAGWVNELVYFQKLYGGVTIYYEDLMAYPESTLKTTFEALGLKANNRLVRKAADQVRSPTEGHITADSGKGASASVGRWRRDLPPELADAANEAFRDALIHFGYETGGRADPEKRSDGA